MSKFFDAVEKWMIESGLLTQLSFLIAKTTILRSIILWGAGIFGTTALQNGAYAEVLLAAAVTVATGSVTMFITHVRNKHAAALQSTLGVTNDNFIGEQTVSEAKAVLGALKDSETKVSDLQEKLTGDPGKAQDSAVQ